MKAYTYRTLRPSYLYGPTILKIGIFWALQKVSMLRDSEAT